MAESENDVLHVVGGKPLNGTIKVRGISLIDRGYADFRGKLAALGADFE